MNLALFLLALVQAEGAAAVTPPIGPTANSAMSWYGKCLSVRASELETSEEPVSVVLDSATTACGSDRALAIASLTDDLKRRPEQWYQQRPAENAEKVLTYVERKMRENLQLQIVQLRAERRAK